KPGDGPEEVDRVRWVVALAGGSAGRGGRQAPALVVAGGRDVDPGPVGELAGAQAAAGHLVASASQAKPSRAAAASSRTSGTTPRPQSAGVTVKATNPQHACSRTSRARTRSGSAPAARTRR